MTAGRSAAELECFLAERADHLLRTAVLLAGTREAGACPRVIAGRRLDRLRGRLTRQGLTPVAASCRIQPDLMALFALSSPRCTRRLPLAPILVADRYRRVRPTPVRAETSRVPPEDARLQRATIRGCGR